MQGNAYWTVARVRQVFIDYFVNNHNHKYIHSSPVLPFDDPTILFTNAGMNQFKHIFQGVVEKNSTLWGLKRAVNSQKCIRAGGKHNDLDDVGKDTYHHTLFEMLGSWSFGDYFKEEAVSMAWCLLTEVYKLPKEQLYITYFEGDEKLGLEPDLEVKKCWLKLGIDESRLIPGNSKDNFWEMGDVGPCGPCSEIHFDRIGNRDAAHLVNKDDPEVIEIWNIVFIQFDRKMGGKLLQLPNKHVDTGMGLERIVSVLQNKMSNYDTDVFIPIFETIEKITGVKKYTGKVGSEDTDMVDTAYRVVADHARMLCFAISDGGIPSNEGRGYVIRRVIRRGVRFAKKYLLFEDKPVFPPIIDTVIEQFSDFFPELNNDAEKIKSTILEEERLFKKTLARGERILDKCMKKVVESGEKIVSSTQLWKMYDTYGFPIDLTIIMVNEAGLEADTSNLKNVQDAASELSRKSRERHTLAPFTLGPNAVAKLKYSNVKITDDSYKYQQNDVTAKILTIFDGGKFVEKFDRVDTSIGLVLDKTPFYAEAGGQVNDTGMLENGDISNLKVTDVKSYGGYILHTAVLLSGSISVNDEVTTILDWERRFNIMKNHTGTHLLNFALREVLGDDVDQKGSLVLDKKFRFDFSHSKAMEESELVRVEKICNEMIKKDLRVYSSPISLDITYKIPGIRAVFGEKYPDPALLVTIGQTTEAIEKDPTNPEWKNFSIEFCGGTHVSSTSKIKHLIFTEECGISSGVRRVTLISDKEAESCIRNGITLSKSFERLKNAVNSDLNDSIKNFSKNLEEANIPLLVKIELRREFAQFKKNYIQECNAKTQKEINDAIEMIDNYFSSHNNSYVIKLLPYNDNTKVLSKCVEHVKSQKNKACFIAILSDNSSSVKFQCYVPKEFFNDGKTAKDWAKLFSDKVNGRFGGKDEMVSGSGSNVNSCIEALGLIEEFAMMRL